MFETRSEAWAAVGLEVEINRQAVRQAARRLPFELLGLIAVIVGRNCGDRGRQGSSESPRHRCGCEGCGGRPRPRLWMVDLTRSGKGNACRVPAHGPGDRRDRGVPDPAVGRGGHNPGGAGGGWHLTSGAGGRRCLHRDRRRPRRPADAREPLCRHGALECPTVPPGGASALPGGRARREESMA